MKIVLILHGKKSNILYRMVVTDHLCELYIDVYTDLFFIKDGEIYSVLFHVIKSHLIKRINIYKEELMMVAWAPERIHFCFPKDDIDRFNESLRKN